MKERQGENNNFEPNNLQEAGPFDELKEMLDRIESSGTIAIESISRILEISAAESDEVEGEPEIKE